MLTIFLLTVSNYRLLYHLSILLYRYIIQNFAYPDELYPHEDYTYPDIFLIPQIS